MTWTDHDNMSIAHPASGMALQVNRVVLRQAQWAARALGHSVAGVFASRAEAKAAAVARARELAGELAAGLR